MSFPPSNFLPLLTKISAHLTTHNQKVSVAETACGGLISAALLSVPGASTYYAGGATLYTLPSRKVFAGWTDEDVKKYNGTVVLAIVGPGIQVSKIAKTNLGNDRVGNMIEFARLALEYLLEQMTESQAAGDV